MSAITFKLIDKALCAEWNRGEYIQRLTFRLRLPKGEELGTDTGLTVADGYVELSRNEPRFSEPMLCYVEPFKDEDTGQSHPASVSFYAAISPDIFDNLLSAPSDAAVQISINTELMGAIRFGDPLGFKKEWMTEQETQVRATGFKVVVSYGQSDA